jgi:periplasmic protein TonB
MQFKSIQFMQMFKMKYLLFLFIDVFSSQIAFAQAEKKITITETLPEFPNGREAMFKYLKGNMKMPKVVQEKLLKGTVIVTFVVDSTGDVVNVGIKKSDFKQDKVVKNLFGQHYKETAIESDKECEQACIDVFKAMPKWTPGRQQGRAVRVQFTVPVRFYWQ